MPFDPRVERWRETAARVSPKGLPVDLVLASIALESGGAPGICSSVNACGLMQVKPSVVIQYNASNKPIPFERMRGKSSGEAADQIRIGSWLLAHHLKIMHKADPVRAPWPAGPLTPWQVMAADLRYSHGGGAFNSLRKGAKKAGYPDTFEGWRDYQSKERPSWTSEKPFFHAWAVWAAAMDGGGNRKSLLARYQGPAAAPPAVTPASKAPAIDRKGGAGVLLALFAFGLFASTR